MKQMNDKQRQKLFDAVSNMSDRLVDDTSLSSPKSFNNARKESRSAVTKWVIVAAATVALVAVMFTCFILNGVVRERWGQPTTSGQPGSEVTTLVPSGSTTESPNVTEQPDTTENPKNSDCAHTHTQTNELEARCDGEGIIWVECADCGQKLSEQRVPALGHDYDEVGLCRRCGYGETASGYRFRRKEDGSGLVFLGVGSSFREKRLDIPSEYCGEPVTEVKLEGISDSSTLGFESPLQSATVLHIPASVKKVSGDSFLYPELEELLLEEGLEYIGELAFMGTGISSVVIPSTVKTIEGFAFADCEKLSDIRILCSFEGISDYAFMGNSAFEQMPGYKGPPKGLEWSFYLNQYVAGVDLEGCGSFHEPILRLEPFGGYIREGAFRNCTFLEEVYIAAVDGSRGGHSTNDEWFAGCTNLKIVEIKDAGWDFYGFGERVFFGCTSLETVNLLMDLEYLASYPLEWEIPKSCFEGCDSLKEIRFGGTCDLWIQIMNQTNGSDALPIGTVIHCTDGDLAAEKNWDSFTRISG